MERHSIISLNQAAAESRVDAQLHGQVESIARKETRDGKPYFEVTIADAEARLPLRAWSDGPAFSLCEGLVVGAFLEVSGEFSLSGAYGLESKHWKCRALTTEERDELLGGSPALRAKQDADFACITNAAEKLGDPRLKALTALFLADFGERFRRAAAARSNHHARRGGLIEHVAQMLRTAQAIASAYGGLNRDLLTAGVIFHDCGKLWENALPPDGFTMPFNEHGELLGHITIGIEVVNTLWRKLQSSGAAADWAQLQPPSEDVRLHLLHLLAAHHGELQFGSPVPPKTPEAWVLHYVDNMDAKLEMLSAGYASSKPLAPRIQERVWPLPGNLVKPLPAFVPADEPPADVG